MCLAVYIPFDPSFSHKNGLVQTFFLIQKVNFIFLNAFGMFEPWSEDKISSHLKILVTVLEF